MKRQWSIGAIALTALAGVATGAFAQNPHAGHHTGKTPAKKAEAMSCSCPCMKEGMGMMGKGHMGKGGMMGKGHMGMMHGDNAKTPPPAPEAPKKP